MAAIDFPSSPSNLDTFEAGGQIYQYNGTKGYWEVVNLNALTGFVGSRGSIGYTGSQGIIGYTGSRGATGFTGSQGIIGYTGSRGATGFTGSQGIIGYTGSQGIQGVIGYTGSRGATGFTGSQGIIGYTGSQGIQGIQGFTGSQGSGDLTGPASATDNAVVRFDGTTGKLVQNSAVTIDDNGFISTSQTTANLPAIRTSSADGWLAVYPTLGAGAYNPISVSGDIGLIFSTDGASGTNENNGLVIAPWSASTSGIRLLENGNVGIGTSSPDAKLYVKDGTVADQANQPSGNFAAVIYHASNADGENGLLIKNNWAGSGSTLLEVGNDLIGTGYRQYFKIDGVGTTIWSPNASEAMRLTTAGRLGIGTNNPSTPLHVIGTVTATAFGGSGGVSQFNNDAGIDITNTGQINGLQIYQPTAQADAVMTFHVGGDFALHFGLDGETNDLSVGGWSMGANKYKVWHAGNDGSGSTLDADLLDGQQGSYYLDYNNFTNTPASGGVTTGKAIAMAIVFG
jgi:hypothetical protein